VVVGEVQEVVSGEEEVSLYRSWLLQSKNRLLRLGHPMRHLQPMHRQLRRLLLLNKRRKQRHHVEEAVVHPVQEDVLYVAVGFSAELCVKHSRQQSKLAE
jgi:hypothetical protein